MNKGKERKEWIENEVRSLASETDEARKSERVKEYLEFCTRFHHYSSYNTWWLLAQSIEKGIEPTRFAGLKTWNSMNRLVKSGETAFRVFAPQTKEYFKEKTSEVAVVDPISGEPMVNSETGEPITERNTSSEVVKRLYFRIVPVFDLLQTKVIEGKEDLYIPFESVISADGEAERILPLVMEFSNAVKPVVEVEDLHGALGNTDYNMIRVLKRLEPATKVETLLHESAHVLLEHHNRDKGKETRETEAATVAYVVSRYLGLAPGGSRYLAIWNQGGQAIMACMERVLKVVSAMIENLEKLAQKETVSLAVTAGGVEVETAIPGHVESVYEVPSYEAGSEDAEEEEEGQQDPKSPWESRSPDDEPEEEPDEETETEVEEEPEGEPQEVPPEGEAKAKPVYDGNLVIEKKALKAVLDQASRYLTSRGMMPILAGVYFRANDGKVEALATDLEMYGVIKAEAKGKGTLNFVVNAKDLKDIVKKLKGNEVNMIAREDKLVLTDGAVILELATMPEEDFPMRPKGKFSELVVPGAGDFRSALDKVLPAASTDEKRPALVGVLFNFEEGALVTTDSYRLAIYDTGWTAGDTHMLVPARCLTQFLKHKEKGDKVKISCNEDATYSLFERGSTSLYIRNVEGKFPRYHQYIDGFEESTKLKLRLSTGEFIKALDSVDYVNTVRVRIDGDDVQLSVEARDPGISAATGFKATSAERMVREEKDEEEDGTFFTAFNSKFLKDGLSCMQGEADLHLQEPLKPALFKSGSFSYLIMPIRL